MDVLKERIAQYDGIFFWFSAGTTWYFWRPLWLVLSGVKPMHQIYIKYSVGTSRPISNFCTFLPDNIYFSELKYKRFFWGHFDRSVKKKRTLGINLTASFCNLNLKIFWLKCVQLIFPSSILTSHYWSNIYLFRLQVRKNFCEKIQFFPP